MLNVGVLTLTLQLQGEWPAARLVVPGNRCATACILPPANRWILWGKPTGDTRRPCFGAQKRCLMMFGVCVCVNVPFSQWSTGTSIRQPGRWDLWSAPRKVSARRIPSDARIILSYHLRASGELTLWKKNMCRFYTILGFPLYVFAYVDLSTVHRARPVHPMDQLRKEHDGAIEGARLRESDRQGERERGKDYEQTGKGCSTIIQ